MAIRRTQQSQPKQPVAPAEAPKDSVEAKAPETKPEEAQKPEAVQPERPKPGASIPKRAELEQEASRTKDKAEKNLPPSSKVQPTQAQISRFIDNRVQENRHKEGPAFEQESLALQGVKKDMESGKLEPNVAWRRVKEIGAWTDATEKLRVDANTARAEEVEKMNPLQRAGEFWGGVGDGAVDMAKGLHDVAKDINQMNPLYAANNAVIDSVGNFMKTGDLKGSVSDAVNKQLNEMGQATERNLERGKALTNLAWNAGPGYVVNSAVEVANVAGDTLALAQQGKLTPETFLESSKAHALNNPSKRMFKKIGDSFINADRVGGATDPRNIGRTALNVFCQLGASRQGRRARLAQAQGERDTVQAAARTARKTSAATGVVPREPRRLENTRRESGDHHPQTRINVAQAHNAERPAGHIAQGASASRDSGEARASGDNAACAQARSTSACAWPHRPRSVR